MAKYIVTEHSKVTEHLWGTEGKKDSRNLENWTVNKAEKTANYWPIAVVIGALLCVGGILLILAGHQILPGVNTLGDLDILRYPGYAVLGLGLIFTLVGGVKWYLTSRNDQLTHSETKPTSEVKIPVFNEQAGTEEILNSLFESRGGFNEFPAFPEPLEKVPEVRDMREPIVTGRLKIPNSDKTARFVAIHLVCRSTKEELLKMGESGDPQSQVLILYESVQNGQTVWQQGQNSRPRPNFFVGPFIVGGRVPEREAEALEKLKTLIQYPSLSEEDMGRNPIKWQLFN